jgi:hypothetical protein
MKSYIYACLFLSIVFNAVNCSQELNGTNATTNIAVPIVQLPYPVFPQLDQKQLDLEKKIALIRDGLKEIARARIAVTHTFTNDMENANTLYEEKLSKVRKEFSGIKHKMDKARSTEKIQKTIQSIKDIKTQIEGSKAKLKLTVENVKNVTAQSSKGKKLCQDLAVTAPYDNQYPHAILNQEKNLIQSMRAYLTKLHYGKHTHDALKNEAGDLPLSLIEVINNVTKKIAINTHYAGLAANDKNKIMEDEVLKEMGLVRDDLVYSDQEKLNQKIDVSEPIRRGVLHKKVIDALDRAESLAQKTAPYYTLKEDQKIIDRCFKKWGHLVQIAKSKNAEATSELDENEDTLAALILDLKDLRTAREKATEVALLLPAYHNGLWKSGSESQAISNAYNFVVKQIRWGQKSSLDILRREEIILHKKMKKYVRALDGDAGVAETCVTSKYPLGGKVGGSTDPEKDWNIECEDGLTLKSLWVPTGGERSLEDMKCCKMPTAGYVNAFKCSAEKIEEDHTDAFCSSGVVVGLHAEKRSRAPDAIKCCNIIGSTVNEDKCHRIVIGGEEASGGPTKSVDVWKGECLHNTIMTGFYLNEDKDIIGAKCCETIEQV